MITNLGLMFGLESANPCLRWLLRIVSSFLHLKLKFFNHPINLLEESRNDNSLPIKIMMMRTCLISLPGELGPEGSFLLCPFLFHSLSHAAFELFPEKDGSVSYCSWAVQLPFTFHSLRWLWVWQVRWHFSFEETSSSPPSPPSPSPPTDDVFFLGC